LVFGVVVRGLGVGALGIGQRLGLFDAGCGSILIGLETARAVEIGGFPKREKALLSTAVEYSNGLTGRPEKPTLLAVG
jgi:hypothetical protein